jgi:hypothetical protein
MSEEYAPSSVISRAVALYRSGARVLSADATAEELVARASSLLTLAASAYIDTEEAETSPPTSFGEAYADVLRAVADLQVAGTTQARQALADGSRWSRA